MANLQTPGSEKEGLQNSESDSQLQQDDELEHTHQTEHGYTIREILRAPLIRLRYYGNDRATHYTSWHRNEVLVHELQIRPWRSFRSEIGTWLADAIATAEKSCDKQLPEDIVCKVCYRGGLEDKVVCGNEYTVQGRIHELLLSVLDGMLTHVGHTCESGDFSIVKAEIRKDFGKIQVHESRTQSHVQAIQGDNQQLASLSSSIANRTRARSTSDVTSATSQVTIDDADERQSSVRSSKAKHVRLKLASEFSEHRHKTVSAEAAKEDKYSRTPDFVTVKMKGEVVLIVTEVKTPWKHKIGGLAELWTQDSDVEEHLLKDYRLWLGQIVGYMQDMSLRYGYLTTYDETVVLQLCEEDGEWCVLCSPIIKIEPPEDSPKPGCPDPNLRQVLFALLHHCNKDKNYAETGSRNYFMVDRSKPRPKPKPGSSNAT